MKWVKKWIWFIVGSFSLLLSCVVAVSYVFLDQRLDWIDNYKLLWVCAMWLSFLGGMSILNKWSSLSPPFNGRIQDRIDDGLGTELKRQKETEN